MCFYTLVFTHWTLLLRTALRYLSIPFSVCINVINSQIICNVLKTFIIRVQFLIEVHLAKKSATSRVCVENEKKPTHRKIYIGLPTIIKTLNWVWEGREGGEGGGPKTAVYKHVGGGWKKFEPHFVIPTVGYFSLFYFDPIWDKQLTRKRFVSYNLE